MERVRIFGILLTLSFSCVEIYDPPEIQNNNDFLVVYGFLNTSDGSATIDLSRSLALTENGTPEVVSGANVAIESEKGDVFILEEPEKGTYHLSGIGVESNVKYRLTISTRGKEYASAFVDATTAPPIDSLTWRVDGDAVLLHVNTHDDENQTRYYRWEFQETWLYNSAVPSHFRFENGGVTRRDENIHTCWRTALSSEILIASSVNLESDLISDFPLTRIPLNSERFRNRYSIQVTQYAMTKEAYQYWQQLRDNIRETGGLFDAQPSRITGNLRAVGNSNEPVLGNFSVCSVQKKRVFIDSKDVPTPDEMEETVYSGCLVDTLLLADIPSFDGSKLLGTDVRLVPSDFLIGYLISTPICIDCRLTGGVNQRPDFWGD